ncbi:MAG: protein kinase [Myxococcales bacterium]|nr:protein kinase [Myxococcales bacterium]
MTQALEHAPPPPELPELPELPERFEVRQRLGEGAFGDVFLARDREHDALVAVKRLRRTETLTRFKREFRSVADLRHPNLVALHELVQLDGEWLLVMEHVPGEPLAAWAGRDAARWRAALPELAAGLRALHDAGHLHRDLSDGNVRRTPEGRVVLLDFGLSSPRGARDAALGNVTGASPEQLAGQPLGPASDWYAVGALLYQAIVGAPPFAGRGPQVLAQKLGGVIPELPFEHPLGPLVQALLTPAPEARMRAARPLLEALGCALPETSRASRFVGRAGELRALTYAAYRARKTLIHVRVEGPSGIGKSTLVDAALDDPTLAPFWGRAFEREVVPFSGIDGILDAVAPHLDAELEDPAERDALATILPRLGREASASVEGAEAFALAARALRRAIHALAAARLPVVVVDDAQWASPDGARLLALAFGQDTPLLLVTIVRTGEPERGFLDVLDARLPVDATLDLGPLTSDEVDALAREHGREDGASIARATEGHPLFVTEMARGAEGSTLPEVLRARVRALPQAERWLLFTLATASRPLERTLAFDVARRLGVEHPFGAFAGLRAARLLTLRYGAHAELELPHAAIAEAARPLVDDAAAVHACFDDAMAELAEGELEARAGHARDAGRPERARSLFARAAHAARQAFAFDHAARLLGEALAATPPEDHTTRRRLQRQRGEALAAAGRGEAAADAYALALDGRSLALGDPETIELAQRRTEQLLHAGRLDRGYAAAHELLGALDLRLPSPRASIAWLIGFQIRERLFPRALPPAPPRDVPTTTGSGVVVRPSRADLARRLQADSSLATGLALTNIDSFRGAYFVARSMVLARRAGDHRRYARSVAFLAAYSCNAGWRGVERAQRLIDEAEAHARALGDDYVASVAEAARALRDFHMGEYALSLPRVRDMERRFRLYEGAVRERVTAQIYVCANLAMLGRWGELAEERQRLVDDGHLRQDRFALTNGGSGLMNTLWLVHDEPAIARREARRAIELWSEPFTVQHFFDVFAQARIDLYEGDAERALARVRAARPALRRALLFRMPFVKVHTLDLEARAELLLGVHADLMIVERAIRGIREERTSWAQPFADALEAALAYRRGRFAQAHAAVARARDGFLAHEMSAHAAASDTLAATIGAPARGLPFGAVRRPWAFSRVLAPVALIR